MFILSKKNFLIRRADGSVYRIGKGYAGEIPEDVAQARLVRAAVRGGSILTPDSRADKAIQAAAEEAEKEQKEQKERKEQETQEPGADAPEEDKRQTGRRK